MNNDVMDELARIHIDKIFGNGIIDTGRQPFVMAYNSFILNKEYSMQQKILFLALKAHAGANGDCFPGKDLLAEETKTTVKTVARLLKQLEEMDALLIINRRKESNRKTSNMYILADIDTNTGNFIPSSLDRYRYLKNLIVVDKGK